jgi:transcriptional regulator with XRE-family HTH domain
MPPSAGSPAVRRRRLAAELRRLRGRRTGNEVAAGLGWSASKISRFEAGRSTLPIDEVEKLLDFYGVSGPDRSQLVALAHDANRRGWWEDYADAIPEEFRDFIGLEAEATSISEWQVEIVPGLLQTEDYARQVFLGYQTVIPIAPGVVEQRVKLRMRRQERLTGEPAVQLSVVLDESVLLRRLGDNGVMRAQLHHLAVVATRPNVDLRVLPLDNHRTVLANSFTLFRFDDAMLHDIVTTESVVSGENVEDENDTYSFRLFFESLIASALRPAESRDMILRIAEQGWT